MTLSGDAKDTLPELWILSRVGRREQFDAWSNVVDVLADMLGNRIPD